MSKIIFYEHHGKYVGVREDLKGKHREYCLCWQCDNFKPENKEENCPIANLNFALDCLVNIVTPVWECPKFCKKSNK